MELLEIRGIHNMSYLTTLILLIIYTQIPSKMKKSNLFLIFSLWGCAQTDMKCSWKVSQVHAGDKIGFSKPLKLASLSQFCLPCELEKIFHSHFISVFSQPKEKILRTKYYCSLLYISTVLLSTRKNPLRGFCLAPPGRRGITCWENISLSGP